ncbi:hypothetical protein LCL97_23520 [Seohaeicola saemankumensis]|nr:hypothetical protein [Seohaeicola saemankumensis]MCA0873812.1 hypothetical protein [Seohaeicola saemankumensis]
MSRNVSCTAAMLVLSACSGTMQGVVRGDGTRVAFQYEQGAQNDTYRAQLDGEQFLGKAVFADAVSGYIVTPTSLVPYKSTTGNLIATLLGNRGSTMSCKMTYANSSGLTNDGGIGVCQHSDGRIIDVVW